ncbi:MAG: MBG domain-containing protein, partial [Prosthecobacter sp.]
ATITYKIGTTYVSTPPTDAGSYAVKAVAGGVTKTGTLVIAKAPLYVTPDDQRKFAGKVNPVLTYSITGYRGTDTTTVVTKAPILKTTATTASPGGLYPITASGATALNYTFIYQQGTLVVESFAGSYEALLVDGDGRPVGKLGLTVTAPSTAFTAKLSSATETSALSFTGPLNTDPTLEQATGSAMMMKSGIPYAISFTLPLNGSVTASATRDSLTLGSTTDGQKLSTATVLYAGAHTVVLEPATPGAANVPVGAGWATAAISTTGVLTLTGKLGDGTTFTSTVSPDGMSNPGYRVFVQPYLAARSHSFLAGSFNLIPHPTLSNRRYVVAADMTWKKSGLLADASYRSGFGPVNTVLMLDPWQKPVAATMTLPAKTLPQRLGLGAPNFAVAHSATGSAANGNLPTRLALSTTNVVSVLAPVTNPVNITKWKTATFNTTDGTFTGSFELIDGTVKRPVTFSGILRQPAASQDPLIGDGHYLLPPVTGTEKSTGEVNFQRP